MKNNSGTKNVLLVLGGTFAVVILLVYIVPAVQMYGFKAKIAKKSEAIYHFDIIRDNNPEAFFDPDQWEAEEQSRGVDLDEMKEILVQDEWTEVVEIEDVDDSFPYEYNHDGYVINRFDINKYIAYLQITYEQKKAQQ
jgi:hypothetical protein